MQSNRGASGATAISNEQFCNIELSALQTGESATHAQLKQ